MRHRIGVCNGESHMGRKEDLNLLVDAETEYAKKSGQKLDSIVLKPNGDGTFDSDATFSPAKSRKK